MRVPSSIALHVVILWLVGCANVEHRFTAPWQDRMQPIGIVLVSEPDLWASPTSPKRFRAALRKFAQETGGKASLSLLGKMAEAAGFEPHQVWIGSDSFLAAQDNYLQKAVLQCLTDADVPFLVRMAREAPHVPARNHAIQFLLWMDAKQALPDLRKLTSDPEETVRMNAARAVEVLFTNGRNRHL